MDSFNLFSLIFQLDDFLKYFISVFGPIIYVLVSIMIFCETGLFAFFLPVIP